MKHPKFVISQAVYVNNYRRKVKNLGGEWTDGEWEEAFIEEAEYSLRYQRWLYTAQLRRRSTNGKILRLQLEEREISIFPN